MVLETFYGFSMRQFLLIIALFMTATAEAQYSRESFTLENDLEYIDLESTLSETKVTGFVEGGRLTHQYRFGLFGLTDMIYSGYGELSGEDAFDDDVKFCYFEIDGEFWVSYLFHTSRYALSPFIGWGVRQHKYHKTRPVKLDQEVNYLYLPIGIKANSYLTRAIGVGALVKVDVMTYTWWKYRHPAICEKSRDLETSPVYEARAWMTYWLSPRWRATVGGSFRYLQLLFPEDVLFAPEPKKQLNFGFRAGLDYHY